MQTLALHTLSDITRGLSIGLALSGSARCPDCSPTLHCPELPRLPDCICQGVERVTPSTGCDCSGERGYLLIILLLVGLACGAIGYCLGLRHRGAPSPDLKRFRDLPPVARKGKGGVWWDGSSGRSSSSGGGGAAIGE
jgi:hypothetical protein